MAIEKSAYIHKIISIGMIALLGVFILQFSVISEENITLQKMNIEDNAIDEKVELSQVGVQQNKKTSQSPLSQGYQQNKKTGDPSTILSSSLDELKLIDEINRVVSKDEVLLSNILSEGVVDPDVSNVNTSMVFDVEN